MILDNLYTSLCDYGNMDDRIARALEWLKAFDTAKFEPKQTIKVDGDRIKALTQEYETIAPENGKYELHRVYADIQFVLSGSETIYWTPASRLDKVITPYNYDKDIILLEDPAIDVPIRLEAGDFAILFPTDGHKPKCMVEKPSSVRKIVMKVAV